MKLHLGCGCRDFKGWVNVDLVDLPHINYKTSIDNLEMFDDGCADVIYSSHTLEYFDRFQVLDVLAEWRRCLKPNGILRIAVPNFESLVEVYMQTNNLTDILGPIYGRMNISTPLGDQCLYHKTVYDFNSLKKILSGAGFGKIEKYDWRQTEHAQYDDHSQAYFPHMDKEKGLLVSLNVEAEKC
tara:strand:- start:342 stop:893 length:552 start_codon:yes stop_codon:yes gene_type:complete